jgi:predicted Zn finger-like uncharacterized protein
MNFNCPGCQVGYRIDENKIPLQGTHSRCKQCGTRFLLTREGVKAADAPDSAAPPEPPPQKASPPEPPPAGPTPPAAEAVPGLSALEAKLDALLKADDQDAAADLFLEIITLCAKHCVFDKAQGFLDRMYDDTPMALNTILKAGEMLEAEKCDAIDPEHLERWNALYEELSPDETSALFFATKRQRFGDGETILRQGDVDGRLCLIEEGKLDIVFEPSGDEEIVKVTRYEAGTIMGADLFFSFSVCTFSAIAVDEVVVRFIEKSSLFEWMTNLPGLESKLRIQVEKLKNVSNLVVDQGIERRTCERHPAKIRAVCQTAADEAAGIPPSSYNVLLADLSIAGAGLEVKFNKPKEAEMLLGSHVKIDFTVTVGDQQKPVSLPGTMVAVRFYAFGDCTMHVNFPKPLSEKAVAAITA